MIVAAGERKVASRGRFQPEPASGYALKLRSGAWRKSLYRGVREQETTADPIARFKLS